MTARPSPSAAWLRQLLSSGAFSDLTLMCEGHELKVHKNVVCSQSSVLSNAVTIGLQETITSTIHVDFDLASTKAMVSFLYTGSYDAVTSDDTDSSTSGDEVKMTHSDTSTPQTEDRTAMPTELAFHSKMNNIGDYYDIAPLVKLANANAWEYLSAEWSADNYCQLVGELEKTTNDKTWCEILAQLGSIHSNELVKHPEFAKLESVGAFATEMLKAHNKKFLDLRERFEEDTMGEV